MKVIPLKKYVGFLIVLLFSNLGYSQIYYSNYLDATSVWKSYDISFVGTTQITYITRYFDGFENHNGYTYYKQFGIMNYNGSIISDPTSYSLWREGSDGNFYSYNPTTGVEQVFFQNANIAVASIGMSFSNFYNHQNDTCNVSSIQTIALPGLNLKHLLGAFGSNTGIAEGIGEVGATCIASVDGWGGLVCYSKQGQTIHFNTSVSCDLFPEPVYLSINTIKQPVISIYPNPTNSNFTVNPVNERINKIEIYDTQGRILKVLKPIDSIVSIDISEYAKGTYFVLIETEMGLVKEKISKH
jgi:hypothetical protein